MKPQHVQIAVLVALILGIIATLRTLDPSQMIVVDCTQKQVQCIDADKEIARGKATINYPKLKGFAPKMDQDTTSWFMAKPNQVFGTTDRSPIQISKRMLAIINRTYTHGNAYIKLTK